jgi:hypothetical protein
MKIEVKQKHINLAPKLFSKQGNSSQCCPIAIAVKEKFPNKVVSVGWGDDVSPNYLNTIDKKMFHEHFFIAVSEPDGDLDEILYKDGQISDLEICSNFAEKYDNGENVKPFEFELREEK